MTPSEPPAVDPPESDKTAELQRAFVMFNEVSAALTKAYEALQGRVSSLTEELALANGELRRQYREKEALSERLSSLLDALPAGVVLLDASARVSAVNPAAMCMLGEDLPGQHWGDIVARSLEPTLTLGEWRQGDRLFSMADSVLPSGDGRILLIHDVTSAQRMKEALERSQRLAAMGEMAASLAHQLRTPLATAMLYTANLAEPSLPDASRKKFADKATHQLQRLERLIQDVLLFARGEKIGRDLIVIRDLIAEATQMLDPLMRQQNLEFVVVDRSGDAKITGSRKALLGALINLLENAMQATPSGGKVSLVGVCADEGLRLTVSDSGPGIPTDKKDRIFEPFYTTKGQGTGLGLAIALGIARAHGGNIEAGASAAGGAEFVMSLPLAAMSEQEWGNE